MKKTIGKDEKNVPGAGKSRKRYPWEPGSAEAAWEMPMEDVMAIPLDELFEDYVPVTEGERKKLLNDLGKPTGVGLPDGYVDGLRVAISNLVKQRGDVVTKNVVSVRGVGEVRIMRLGRAPEAEHYVRQVVERFGRDTFVSTDAVDVGDQKHELRLIFKKAV